MTEIYSGILGLIVGDALGVPMEFRRRDTFKVEDMTGYGTHYQPPGTWSDDSSMVLATMDALSRPGAGLYDIMYAFESWLAYGNYTPWGKVFDVGGTTEAAIKRFTLGVPPDKCGGDQLRDNGNGSLMRILPLAFTACDHTMVEEVSSLTHAHEISKCACVLYANIARELIRYKSKKEALTNALALTNWGYVGYSPDSAFSMIAGRLLKVAAMDRDSIKSTGYVVDTLEAALWCLMTTDNYRDCVLTAVNLGGDTDTIAAVAGGLAGILYGIGGEKGVPLEWIIRLARLSDIIQICINFEKRFREVGKCQRQKITYSGSTTTMPR